MTHQQEQEKPAPAAGLAWTVRAGGIQLIIRPGFLVLAGLLFYDGTV